MEHRRLTPRSPRERRVVHIVQSDPPFIGRLHVVMRHAMGGLFWGLGVGVFVGGGAFGNSGNAELGFACWILTGLACAALAALQSGGRRRP